MLSWREASNLWIGLFTEECSLPVEGALVEEGTSVVGLVAEGGHTTELHSCGGFSITSSQLASATDSVVLRALYGGHTFLGHTWFFWTCIPDWIKLLLYQVHLYFIFAVFHLLLSSYIDIYPKLILPGGDFIQGYVDQKYLCTK
jgi:hypothetical protein